MTATQIIREIESLDPDAQAQVVRFAIELGAKRKLTGPELTRLAQQMTDCTDPAETAVLREQLERGFYGGEPNA